MIYQLNLQEKLKSYTSEYEPLFKNRNLIMLVFAGIISSFGSKITYFALLRKVYTITGGKIASLGALSVFEILPSIIFGAVAGFIIDRISRKWSMVVSDILSGVTILTVIFIQDIKLIYLIAFLNASVNVFRIPAQRAFEPNLVEKENIPLLNSFNSFANNFTQIVGAATGAAIVGFVGVNTAFIIDALTFWTSAIIITTIRAKELHLEERGKQIKAKAVGLKQSFKEVSKEFVEGSSIMWHEKSVKLMVFIDLYFTFAMTMQGVLIYYFIKETLKMGDKAELAWGILLSSLGVGALIGSLILGVVVKRYKKRFKLFLNALMFDAVVFTIFLLNKYFPLSIVLFALLGIISSAYMIILYSVIQNAVPDENRGKVFGVLSMLKSPIGILSVTVGTAAATLISAQGVLLLAAAIEASISIGVRFTKTYRDVE